MQLSQIANMVKYSRNLIHSFYRALRRQIQCVKFSKAFQSFWKVDKAEGCLLG